MPTHGSERPQPRKPAQKSLKNASAKFDAVRLGKAIRVLRKSRDLNVAQFATLTGLSRQGVAVLEAGLVEPTISTLEKIAKVAGLTLLEIMALGVGTDEPIKEELQSALGLIRKLDDKSRRLAVTLLTALAKHQGN